MSELSTPAEAVSIAPRSEDVQHHVDVLTKRPGDTLRGLIEGYKGENPALAEALQVALDKAESGLAHSAVTIGTIVGALSTVSVIGRSGYVMGEGFANSIPPGTAPDWVVQSLPWIFGAFGAITSGGLVGKVGGDVHRTMTDSRAGVVLANWRATYGPQDTAGAANTQSSINST